MRTVLVGVALLAPLVCSAEPLITINCEAPKGVSQDYGVPGAERVRAATEHKPQPADHFTGPYQDGFTAKPTFIVDSSRKKLTLLWAESAGEKALCELSKQLGHKWEPDPAREVRVIAHSPEFITAIDAHAGRNEGAVLYSFYPKLGVVFVAQHYLDINGSDAAQSAFFAKCEFSWSGTP